VFGLLGWYASILFGKEAKKVKGMSN